MRARVHTHTRVHARAHHYPATYQSTKHKNKFIYFFLALSLVSTIYYHQKYISKRDTLILRDVILKNPINSLNPLNPDYDRDKKSYWKYFWKNPSKFPKKTNSLEHFDFFSH